MSTRTIGNGSWMGLLHSAQGRQMQAWVEVKAFLFSTKLNLLMVAFPLAIASQAADFGDGPVFILSLLALCPLAERLGFVTEQLAMYTNDTLGGLLNASFGNATELIICGFALHHGLLRIVQLSLLGSVVSNLLLVLGSAFIAGGLRGPSQTFNQEGISVNCGLLLLSCVSVLLPSLLKATHTESHGSASELALSRSESVLLLLSYFSFLLFQLYTHSHLYDNPDRSEDVSIHASRASATPVYRSVPSFEISGLSPAKLVQHTSRRCVSNLHNHSSRPQAAGEAPAAPLRLPPPSPSPVKEHKEIQMQDIESPLGAGGANPLLRRTTSGRRSAAAAAAAAEEADAAVGANPLLRKTNSGRRSAAVGAAADEADAAAAANPLLRRTNSGRRAAAVGAAAEEADAAAAANPLLRRTNSGRRAAAAEEADTATPTNPWMRWTNSGHWRSSTNANGAAEEAETSSVVKRSASQSRISQIMEGTREDVSVQARASESVSEQAGGSIAEPEGEGDQPKLEEEDEELVLSRTGCFLWLAAVTCCIALLSEWIMDAIEGASKSMGVPLPFLTTILLPIVGNAAEHASAIVFAYRNRIEIALGVAVGSATQIAVLVIPFLVVLAWILGKPLDLNFNAFEATTYFLSILLASFTVVDGKGNWLKGLLLLLAYVFISAGFWLHKDENLVDENLAAQG